MSQLVDLTDTFKSFKARYGWDDEEVIDNFLEVLGNLEWELVWDRPRLEDGTTNWVELDKQERIAAKQLLGINPEQNDES